MKESKTTYSYLIEHMQDPSFQKVWEIAFDFVNKLPSELCDELHNSLNRGIDVLDSEPLLQMYIYSFGKMHNAKLQYAFNHLHKNSIKYKEIEIVDYGCGQGIATICYHDFIKEHNLEQRIKKIILIEPSSMALSRAELLCSSFFPNAEIIAINKSFDKLTQDDLKLSAKIPTIHLLSNILDVESYDLIHFSQIVKEQSIGDNEYVLVSPMQNTQRTQRLKSFASSIEKNIYFEEYLDKRELDKEKDWTCALLLCSQRNIIEYDCNDVFEEALLVSEKKDVELDENFCKEVFHKLQVCAKFGDAKCQNQLGIFYLRGIATEKNYLNAYEWFKKSAEQNYATAFANLGQMYHKGLGVEQDINKAILYYKNGADNNNSFCKIKLGCVYILGKGVEKDFNKAFKLFSSASNDCSNKKDYSQANYLLFKCFYNGWGTEKDEKFALKALKASVKADHPKACFVLADFYKDGGLVKKDDSKALQLYRRSAKLEYIEAEEMLGDIYRKGILGEKESPKKSFLWYQKAAEKGSSYAQFYVAYFYAKGYGVEKNEELAFKWYTSAAKQDDLAALNNLGVCYEYGKGTKVDLSKASYYYEQAAKLGNSTAQKNLANCYKNGKGVKKDPQKVFFWTLEASKTDFDSIKTIAFYYLKGYGTNKSLEESLIWYARYYSRIELQYKNNIKDINDAFRFFTEKAQIDDAQAIYIIGKCFQYGIAAKKNMAIANTYFEKAAKLGHVESLIKLRDSSSLCKLCSMKEDENSIKDSYGVIYSKDKKILISTRYSKSSSYKIPFGTRIICDNALHDGYFKKVIIPSSVVQIGKNPFSNNGMKRSDIKYVESHSANFIILDSTLYTRDKKRLISYFGEKSRLTIPDGVEIVGENAFVEDENLVEINFPNSLVNIETGAFSFCYNLKRISLPDNVINIGAKCFYGCESLTEVLSLGLIKTIKEETFMGCDISKLVLPSTLEEIKENAFNSNQNLKNVIFPNSVKKLYSSCFAFCSLNNITLSHNLEEIGDFCFFQCPIKKITIPSKVKKIGLNPFIGTKIIECSDNDKMVSENGMLYNKDNGELIAHNGDKEIALNPPISCIKSFAFFGSNVTDIFMSSNILKIEPWAFYRAEKLENVIWQKCKINNIPTGCFGKCESIYKINIPSSVEEIKKGAFFDCYNLRTIRINGKNTIANEQIFERIDEHPNLPSEYLPQNMAMGSFISDFEERENIDFSSFAKIEIYIPVGSSDKYIFANIYDYDLNNSHVNHGYGMDRTFVIKEDENS